VDSAAWVMVVLAAVLVLVALVVFVLPLVRGDTSPAPSSGAPGAGVRGSGPPNPSGSLARGFGYLYVSPATHARRGGVHERLARAFARVDAVDPHAAPRRIGEALVEAGLVEPAAGEGPVPPAQGWRGRPAERPRDVG
jgi:hypothetical protein